MTRLISVALLLASALSTFADDPKPGPDPRTVVRYGPAYKYPQDGWIVLHIEGEPYERGYQHGRLMATEIAGYLKSLSYQQSTAAPADAWSLTRTLVSSAFLRKIGAEYLEEMKGTADGAAAAGATIHGRAVDLLDIVCANCSAEYDTLESALDALPTGLEGKRWPQPGKPKTMPKPAPDHCSAFAATGPATKEGKIVFGHITMWTLYSTNFYNVWLDVKPAKGHRVLMQSFPGGIWSAMDYYLSDSGLMLTETTIRQTRYNADGIPLADRARRAMQYGRTDRRRRPHPVPEKQRPVRERMADRRREHERNRHARTRHERAETPPQLKERMDPRRHARLLLGLQQHQGLAGPARYLCESERPAARHLLAAQRPGQGLADAAERTHGKIDADFGKRAFMTPPLAAHRSLDAKVTTTAMVKQLQSIALFGPPLGLAKRPTFDQQTKHPDIRPLISNDWTVLEAESPLAISQFPMPVDLGGPDTFTAVEIPANTNPAWTGTLIPRSDSDLWFTSAFAQYERIVALELALKEQNHGTLPKGGSEYLDRLYFRYKSDFRSAVAARPSVAPDDPTEREIDRRRWHKEQVGYGVMALAAMRQFVGDKEFIDVMTAYGLKNGGQTVTVSDFIAFAGKGTNKDVAGFFRKTEETLKVPNDPVYHCLSFQGEEENTIIVYGTQKDVAANREAAAELQKLIRESWCNVTVPIKADRDLTDADRKANHLLLIGRPEANTVTASVHAASMFRRNSFFANESLYAHPGSAVIVAGTNPANPRYSYVLLAGNGAESTWHTPAALMKAPIADLVVLPNGGGVKAMIKK